MASQTYNITLRGLRTLSRWKNDQLIGGSPTILVSTSQSLVDVGFRNLSRVWNRTPNWKLDKRAGRWSVPGYMPMNTYTYSFTEHRKPIDGVDMWLTAPFGCSSKYRELVHDMGAHPEKWNRQSFPGLSAGDLAALDAQARTRVLLEVKDQKVNAVQMYAERMQTTTLFANTAQRVVRAWESLRRGNWNGAAEAVNGKTSARKQRKYRKSFSKDPDTAVASGWLELQYGWLPLLNDVYGAAELIAQKQLREVRERVQKSASRTDYVYDKQTFAQGLANGSMFGAVKVIKRRTTVKYTLYYSTPDESIKTLAQVGITNPALIAWELTPWSFVVDWLLPIGNYLQSLDATLGLQFEKGCKTVHTQWDNTMNVFGGGYSCGLVRNLMSYSTEKRVQIDRSTITSFPRVALPQLKNPFSPTHLANAMSLLRTSTSKR